ncbi:MAG: thermonuclease family protein [Desulfomonilia bacterium]|jgi:micrococcal nuclease|uniref:Thermonuclease n=1 Tax=anaerobic digester metagenome TaxID=1263854 RepID=A0A485LVF7_9ZZZZ|nr:thermonuclease family protein [Pseudomonadota bacterium]HON37766.1 thermonuclease family protein [Deltaproteobacteria bacterium]HRS55656.1 thermonuclease family protein [Desulfomonilia bacterium]HPD20869.1 thermonuclease family protein [Deltaproteobacteria bacterium]HPX19062.1 thermonuclease family protein [Deltaproteobacteria bacterium]
MKDYVRWSFVVLMIVLLVFMLRCAKQLDAHEVVEVYDGDTIRIDDGRNIRLIGVDAPEVDSPYTKEEPFGKESREHLRKLLAGGKVRIEVGPTPVDRYGRTLAYVYAGDVLVNGRIIQDGWARAEVRFSHKNKDLFIAYEKEARARKIGMWKHSP